MMLIDGKEYALKFNLKRTKLIEKELGQGVLHVLGKSDGMMSLTEVETFFKYGLIENGADAFCAPDKAVELCDVYMQEEGFPKAVGAVCKQLYDDMGFLFRTA